MTPSRFIMKPLALACAIALTACSSGGDSSTPATTTISGLAEAPGGVIAQLEYNQSLAVAATNLLFPAAHAGITGLEPVTGATVELIRIDDDGNQVGLLSSRVILRYIADHFPEEVLNLPPVLDQVMPRPEGG